jgi:cell division protein FtsL
MSVLHISKICIMQLGKLSRDEIERELTSTGLSSEAVQGIIEVLSLKSLSKLEGFLLTLVLNIFIIQCSISTIHDASTVYSLRSQIVVVRTACPNEQFENRGSTFS